jgi:hypothetical protein
VARRVIRGDHQWKAQVRDRSLAGASLIRHGDDVIGHIGYLELPVTDVVHGDYSSSNMIVTREGAVRFIDCETIGRGTRVRDLADLYRQCFVYPGTSLPAMRFLRDQASIIAGSAALATCVVGVSYNNLSWWAENRSGVEFDGACQRVHALFDDITGLIT